MKTNPQKSEVHTTTEDASSTPTQPGDEAARTPQQPDPEPRGRSAEENQELFPEGTHVKRDDSDAGGPIDVEINTDSP